MTATISLARSILAVFNPLAMSLSADTYNFFLNEWNCKYVRVTLDKWSINGLVPVEPKMNYMFVHWTADDNEEHWKDIYEVPLIVSECPCCANCWRRHGCPCLRHSGDGYSYTFDKAIKPCRVIGFDFVTHDDTPCVSPVAPRESDVVEHIPRRSKRVKRQTEFYYF